jgi:hypothetical protein
VRFGGRQDLTALHLGITGHISYSLSRDEAAALNQRKQSLSGIAQESICTEAIVSVSRYHHISCTEIFITVALLM